MNTNVFTSVNFHLWEPCNMRCRFCFATFQDVKRSILPEGHLPKEEAVNIVGQLAEAGFQKISFAGGEPTLCPWLYDLIKTAKRSGMTTMIVSNGSRIDDSFLEQNKENLDWISISIDSLNGETNRLTGRSLGGRTPLAFDYYQSLIHRVKKYGYGLKINTVVNRLNYNEDMSEFIQSAAPERWKIFQVLPIEGQNDGNINDLTVNEKQFYQYVNYHKSLIKNVDVVSEANSEMIGSYIMIDPAGRFFDNINGMHTYSNSITEVGVVAALSEIHFDFKKFKDRNGLYDWQKKKTNI